MIPPTIRDSALRAGLNLIAITDHNASENVAAVASACEPEITVLGGMEITTSEEIHVLAICRDQHSLAGLQSEVYEHLDGRNDPDRFGEQYIVDSEGYIIDVNDHLLSGATDLSIDELLTLIHRYEGLAIACHVDRMSFSVVSQLGFIPDTLGLDAVELSSIAGEPHYARDAYSFPVVANSDAHEPDQIGVVSNLVSIAAPHDVSVEEEKNTPGFDNLATALRNCTSSDGAGVTITTVRN